MNNTLIFNNNKITLYKYNYNNKYTFLKYNINNIYALKNNI